MRWACCVVDTRAASAGMAEARTEIDAGQAIQIVARCCAGFGRYARPRPPWASPRLESCRSTASILLSLMTAKLVTRSVARPCASPHWLLGKGVLQANCICLASSAALVAMAGPSYSGRPHRHLQRSGVQAQAIPGRRALAAEISSAVAVAEPARSAESPRLTAFLRSGQKLKRSCRKSLDEGPDLKISTSAQRSEVSLNDATSLSCRASEGAAQKDCQSVACRRVALARLPNPGTTSSATMRS